MERAADLLAKKAPHFNTVAANCRVSDALYQMCCEAVDFLVVMENGKFKGVISDHDIASRILFEDRPLKEIEVWEFMNTSLPVAAPDASLQSCMQLMQRFNAKHLVVYDQFDFKGVISSFDLMHEASHNSEYFMADVTVHKSHSWDY